MNDYPHPTEASPGDGSVASPEYVVLFDIDETLVYAVHSSDEKWTASAAAEVKDMCFDSVCDGDTYHVVVRPYARELLRECAAKWRVGFFTAAERAYAEPIIRELLPSVNSACCFFRDSCQQQTDETGDVFCGKDLTHLVSSDLSGVILIDNLAPSNVVPVENGLFCLPFEVSRSTSWSDLRADTTLQSYSRIINHIIAQGDVRTVIPTVNELFRQRTVQ